MRTGLGIAVSTAILACAATTAQAAIISCPGTAATDDREFTVEVTFGTGTASCYSFDEGNDSPADFPGFTLLDKSDDNQGPEEGWLSITGEGETSGTFTISADAWAAYDSLILVFKSGEGQLDPDWAAFLLTPEVLGGNWTISGNQALSHASLYGGDGDVPIPEPGSLLLLGAGLAAAARSARKRARKA